MAATLLDTRIQFEDINPYTVSGYTVTNEEPMKHHELIKRLKIKRAAAICSAGEVQFFGILPFVEEELILVDHSYDSMYYAMIKYLMLADLGAEETYRLMTTKGEESFKELVSHLKRLGKELPCKEISKYGSNTVKSGYGFGTQIYENVNYSNRITGTFELSNSMSSVWERIPLELVKKAADKLHLVSFVHGDMTDLVDRGPFDLYYISNAHPSNGRRVREQPRTYSPSRTQECFDLFLRSVKKRGYILSSQQHQMCGTLKKKLEPTVGVSSWRYHLYQV